MLDRERFRYDTAGRRLFYDSGIADSGLLSRDAARGLGEIAREGIWEGHIVEAVGVTFEDSGTAKHNADAMAFFGLEAWSGGAPYVGEAKFKTRSDFGIDG